MKKAICASIAIGMLIAVGPACEIPVEAQSASSVNVMSYNIYRGGEMRGQPLSQTVRVIQEANADIVGVQETKSPRGVNADIVVSPYPSDHRAVVATFTLSGQPQSEKLDGHHEKLTTTSNPNE